MRSLLTLAVCLLLSDLAVAQENSTWLTEAMLTAAERSDYARTSTFSEVVTTLEAITDGSPLDHHETLLTTREGRAVPLIVLADPPVNSPDQARASGKPVIYIQGNIHGGEVEGKEASLILMRDMLYGDKRHLLENQIVILVPIYNADGNDRMAADNRPDQESSPPLAGERFAHGYDLNRDGMIVEADETAALFENVLLRWDPDLFVDLHTTNGTWHGYSLTYAPSYHTAGDPAPSAYTADTMLPAIRQAVKEKFDLDFSWFGDYEFDAWPPTEWRTYHHAPRYLTNHMALRNRMAILSETFSHDRFDMRVHAANVFLEEILEYTHRHGEEIRRINREADTRVASAASGSESGVQFRMIALDEPLDLLSYNYVPFRQDDGSTGYVRSAEIVTLAGMQNFSAFEPTRSARKPQAYLFDSSLTALAAKLRQHGVRVETLSEDRTFNGEAFLIDAMEKQDYVQNFHRNSLLRGSFQAATRQFSGGDYIVWMNDRLANLAFYLLEPESDDGLAFWNLFDAILEAGLERGTPVEYPVFKFFGD